MTVPSSGFRLVRDADQVSVRFDVDGRKIPVKIACARPISGREELISMLDRDKKEVAMVESLAALDPESRAVVLEELARRYLFPRITRVRHIEAMFGIQYWQVETTAGERCFALKNDSKNVVWITDQHLVLQDTLGCRYEVRPVSDLDTASRAQLTAAI
jgi:hypothetical protein